MVLWQSWHSWEGVKVALVDNQNASELLSDPWGITRDELDWRGGEEKMTLREELLALPSELETLTVNVPALIARIDNALARPDEFEAAKEATLGIE
jgi:hypothetical protein